MSLAQTSVVVFILYPNEIKEKEGYYLSIGRDLNLVKYLIVENIKCIFNEDVFALTDKTFFITEAQFNKKARVTPDNMAING